MNVKEENENGNKTIQQANWSDFTAGDQGVRVNNIFPNIDLKIEVLGPYLKSSFVVKAPVGKFRIKEKLGQNELDKVSNNPAYSNMLFFDVNGESNYQFSEIKIYDENSKRKGLTGNYLIENGYLSI